MKIVVLDGYTENPGDLSWGELEKLGELTVYDRTSLTDEEEIIAAYDAVTREDVRTLAEELMGLANSSLSAVGRVGKAEEYQTLLR